MEARAEKGLRPAVHYPESDGKPMGETDYHRIEMQCYVIEVLEDRFADQPDVYVAGNNFLYFVEGKPRRCVSPDAYVVKGVARHPRRTYKVWEEGGRTPCVVFEITSDSTQLEDRGDKLAIYRDDLHVPEYFLFDPLGEWMTGQLRGYRLADEVYMPMAPVDGRLSSSELGLDVLVHDGHLRFRDPATGALLPIRRERADAERQRADAERQRADAERQRADALAVDVERLRAEVDRLRRASREG